MTELELIEDLIKRGYVIKRQSTKPVTRRNIAKKEGIRIEWNDNGSWFEVYVRTTSGGFSRTASVNISLAPGPNRSVLPPSIVHQNAANVARYKTILDGLDKFQAPGVQPKPKPQPYKFSNDTYSVQSNKQVILLSQIRSVETSIVCLEANGHINTVDIFDPNKPIWYMCDCTGHAGATFNFITDGDIIYPVRRYPMTNMHITACTHPKESVDMTKLSKIDHELVLHAIEEFKRRVM